MNVRAPKCYQLAVTILKRKTYGLKLSSPHRVMAKINSVDYKNIFKKSPPSQFMDSAW